MMADEKKKANEVADTTMADVEAKIAEMLKAAEAKAEEMLNTAKEEAENIVKVAQEKVDDIVKTAEGKDNKTAGMPEEIRKAIEEGEEYIDIMLFKDGGKYKDDVFVAINGENALIKRGEPVKIKKKFAALLRQSDIQDAKAVEYMEQRANEFAKESAAKGL